MLFVWGTKSSTDLVESGEFYCPHCADFAAYSVNRVQQSSHVYGVSVGPGSVVAEYVECGKCGSRCRLDPDWLGAGHDGLLGSDWALVLQSPGGDGRRATAVVRELLQMGESEAVAALQGCPLELQHGLRYWQAHRLRKQFGDRAVITVEFRP
jgi:hypothetical protein